MSSITLRVIASDTAEALISTALRHAADSGWQVAAAVVDPSGQLVAFRRMDRAIAPAGDFACDKAWTAATLGKSSRVWGARVLASDTLRAGHGNRPRLMTWGGGVAVFEDGICIGGLGVSGAQEDEDILCAETAIRAQGLTPG